MLTEEFTDGWQPIHVGFGGAPLSINGINPWLQVSNWQRVSQKHIVVPHPAYPNERHRAWVYEITIPGKAVCFAATELSNGVWGFYVQPDTAS
ncbi:hypothetical protein AWB77_04626 [Caballeronia fortuita]|uniref:Uncharacterized protein n=1 Tax=Caballeronia fortuita TaxID=1777138 RepID=A0A158CW70_9BURK|nr:hypothetical protein [Caballeronia fortuita]SAK86588.1 hypothetical protein AWB77_04626 [Caballeronia fortuita]